MGREFNKSLRHQFELSPRPGPKPNLPETYSTHLSQYKYLERDARRLSLPPTEIVSSAKQLTSGTENEKNTADTTISKSSWPPLPGKQYFWKESK
ncbi:uncharacterized protein B4U79_09706 [Dinothrombium tinctorium]|uniref:NADH dehydrogenase [ubiquinone] 1 alpha subcomplex subunit 7 n=1 Tax=Dinothrombium tinctorium TaxID=1965070 RepID=A0A3S3PFZ3_9ACAR|nr:uncharacterized protein B4U79_09706 [Dinothrombium tinctorium]